jgi:hypothetical protein
MIWARSWDYNQSRLSEISNKTPLTKGFKMTSIDVRRTENEVVGEREMDKSAQSTAYFLKKLIAHTNA